MRIAFHVFLHCCSILWVINAFSQSAGTLDPTFEGDGHVLVDSVMRLHSLGYLAAEVVAQPTSKVFFISPSDSARKLGFYKYNPDGTPDMTFAGTGHRHMAYFNGNPISGLEAQVQPDDGKLLVLAKGALPYNTLVRAFTHNADLDTSFALDGTLDSLGPVNDHLRGRQLNYALHGFLQQADGKIITWGTYNGTALIARLLLDGSLDATFGIAGMAREDHWTNGYFSFEGYTAVAILADGTLIASGSYGEWDDSFVTTNYYHAFEARYGANGILISRNDAPPYGEHQQILPTPDGGFIACQYTRTIKVNALGVIDSGFAGTGAITDDIDKLLLQPDGKLLGIGKQAVSWDDSEGWLFRWLPDGNPDTTFGPGGHAFWSASLHRDRFTDLTLQPDGKILVAGFGEESTLNRFNPFLLRYHSGMAVGNDSPLDEERVTLYPNPITDRTFSLLARSPIERVKCCDALGREVVLLQQGSGPEYRLPEGAAAGVYHLRVTVGGQHHFLRIVFR